MLEIKTLSCMAKVFPSKIFGKEIDLIEGARNQELSYQIALSGEGEYDFSFMSNMQGLRFYRVGYVPSDLPIYEGTDDDNYLTYEKGLFPDPLFPFDGKITLKKGQYETIWVTIPKKDKLACAYKVVASFLKDGVVEGESVMEISIHDFLLPEQRTYFTQWFHNDCIASVHGVEILSDAHFELIEKYMALASEHGVNLILTPVLTPPLDTEEGGERPTVQLVDITLENGEYSFDFTNLIRYAEIAKKCGIKNIEVNHMFTQWGAKHAPKVMARVDGEYKKIFGWETDASSEEYAHFLSKLIPEVIKTLESVGFSKENIFFHISDEPSLKDLEQYKSAHDILTPLIEGCTQIDAISNAEFFKEGLIKTPVVSINHIDYFMHEGITDFWGYNCCAQSSTVSNRFFDMPSARHRMIGTQIFKYDIKGFLHWGYNFYYSRFSKVQDLNPYEETSALGAFPSGDAFSVYPYKDGPIPSIRLKIFLYALDDVRLLRLVEKTVGTIGTYRVINACAKRDLTMIDYPYDETFFEWLYTACFNLLYDCEHLPDFYDEFVEDIQKKKKEEKKK